MAFENLNVLKRKMDDEKRITRNLSIFKSIFRTFARCHI